MELDPKNQEAVNDLFDYYLEAPGFLGGGLNNQSMEAVRQWRFSPAQRHGVPVDVIVEVSVEFKLR